MTSKQTTWEGRYQLQNGMEEVAASHLNDEHNRITDSVVEPDTEVMCGLQHEYGRESSGTAGSAAVQAELGNGGEGQHMQADGVLMGEEANEGPEHRTILGPSWQ